MDIGDGRRALCIAGHGLHEYEVKDTERREVALTLLRAVGFLGAGRDPMTIMSGAGPKIPTPGGQCLRELTYRLAVIPHAGTWAEAEIWREAHAFVAGVRAVSLDVKDPTLFGKDGAGVKQRGGEAARSLLRVEGKNAVLSAVKGCDREGGDRRALIVRLFNPSESPTAARLTFAHRVRLAQLTNLDEEPQADLPVAADGSVSVGLGPKKIVTVKVTI
jgi:mannosylglycerate hydrolase